MLPHLPAASLLTPPSNSQAQTPPPHHKLQPQQPSPLTPAQISIAMLHMFLQMQEQMRVMTQTFNAPQIDNQPAAQPTTQPTTITQDITATSHKRKTQPDKQYEQESEDSDNRDDNTTELLTVTPTETKKKRKRSTATLLELQDMIELPEKVVRKVGKGAQPANPQPYNETNVFKNKGKDKGKTNQNPKAKAKGKLLQD